MKEVGTASWNSPNTGATNTSLFTGLPGGSRYSVGYYYYIGDYGYWWSSTEYFANYAWYRSLNSANGSASRASYGLNKRNGLSVRCLRD